jgi:hypothetical protein
VLTESQAREQRVRFKHPIRVVTLDGPPRVIRTLTTNVSRRGLFVRMPQPLPEGCRVALSLEAGGRALAFAQAQVAWGRSQESRLPGRYPGCGVRFTEFLHPKAKDLVEYLVENLDTGKPLTLPTSAAKRRWWMLGGAVAGALGLTAIGGYLLLSPGSSALEGDETLAPLVAVAPSPVELAPAEAAPEVVAPPPVQVQVAAGAGEETLGAAGAEAREPVAAAPPPMEMDLSPAVVEPVEVAAPAVAKVAAAVEAPPAPAPQEAQVVAAPVPVVAEAEARPEVKAPAAPSAAPVAAVTPATPSTSKPSAFVPTTKGVVRLPSGGAVKLAWSSDGRRVRLVPTLAPGAKLAKVFVLAGPSRAVFDVEGVAPKKSHQVDAETPHVSGVRIGKLGRGTRVVVDLQDVPVSHVAEDGSLTLDF